MSARSVSHRLPVMFNIVQYNSETSAVGFVGKGPARMPSSKQLLCYTRYSAYSYHHQHVPGALHVPS